MAIVLDGNNLNTNGLINSLQQQTASGTAVNFTGIPVGVKRVTVVLNNISTASTGVPTLRLGSSGGYENTGYASGIGYISSSAVSGSTSATSGFELVNTGNAAFGFTGALVLYNTTGNVWVINGSVALGQTTYSSYISFINGQKTTSSVLDRLQLTTTAGTDTFDAGTVNVFYE